MTTHARFSAMLAVALALHAAPAFAASDDPADNAEAAEQAADAGLPAEPTVSGEWAGPIDWAALGWHPGPTFALSKHDLNIPGLSEAPATTWSRTENANGSAAVTGKYTLTKGWASSIGADTTLPPSPPPGFGDIDSTLPGASAGAAWATLSSPAHDAPIGLEGTSLGARLDTSYTERKLGVNASKSLPLGDWMSLTLQGGYAATDLTASTGAAPAPTGLEQTRVYTTEQLAKLAILGTRTTIAAGRTLSSVDTRWLHTVTAEQQLFTGVSIAGSIAETPDGTAATSILAKFQRRW
jgi:hypothetical protein